MTQTYPYWVPANREDRNLSICVIYTAWKKNYMVVMKVAAEYEAIAPGLVEYESKYCEGAEIIIVSHG